MTHTVIPYGGWEECVRITNGVVDVVVTTQVGPRIIRYGFCDGPNLFAEYADQMGRRGEPQYRSYGGHRLWVAPETEGWTNHPDNGPVAVTTQDGSVVFTPSQERGTRLQKRIAVSLSDAGPEVTLRHSLTNTGDAPVQCALWAVTVMAPGGTAILPLEPLIPHAEKKLPAGPVVLWHYTNLSDPRWTFGSRFIRLRQTSGSTTPQKLGLRSSAGWAAYVNGGVTFAKYFNLDPAMTYPDFGCNCEIFTNTKMLEVESLGPLVSLAPGETRDHQERWSVFPNDRLPDDDASLASLFSGFLT